MNAAIAVAVVLAGAAGALLRFLVAKLFASRSDFPVAVLVVNVVGSAVTGAVLALAAHAAVSNELRLVLLTGFCGGLTTFSTWSVESIQLVRLGRWRSALLSVVLNLVLGFSAAAAAFALAGLLF